MAMTVRPSSTAARTALEVAGRARVDQRRRLVEHQGVRVGQHQARESDLLRLGSRQRATARADLGVEALGEGIDPVQRVNGGQRGPDRFLVSTRGSGQSQVLPDRPDEDVMLLGDQRDVATQVVQGQLDQAHIADRHRPGARRVDAGQQSTEGGLAGTGRPDHGDPLADSDIEVEIPCSTSRPSTYAEAHILGVELLVHGFATAHGPVVWHLRDTQEPGHRRGTDLQLVEDATRSGRPGRSASARRASPR